MHDDEKHLDTIEQELREYQDDKRLGSVVEIVQDGACSEVLLSSWLSGVAKTKSVVAVSREGHRARTWVV